MDSATSPLLTDLYELAMLQAYLENGATGTAVFELFARKLPSRRAFLMAAGLEQALSYLEKLSFSADDIDWLRSTGHFSDTLLEALKSFRFTGDVHAVPEGRAVFPDEPIVRITAPLPQAQFVETRLMNILHYQTLIASKAARVRLAAPSKAIVDFGLRRAHAGEAGLFAARASYIAGFAGTATLLAERLYGIPTFGTMAHSFVETFDSESEAFERFAIARPQNLTLLIDTYDTAAAARKVVALAPRLAAKGIRIGSVRIDSGDLAAMSRSVRKILDDGGCTGIAIFVSGGLDEDDLAALVADGAPIDGFGVGTSLTTSSDVPTFDCAYKLQEYDGLPRRKKSSGKATWPGAKQVWRRHGPDGRMVGDILALEGDVHEGEPLLACVMKGGRRTGAAPTLAEIRATAAAELARLPDELKVLEGAPVYPVTVAEPLKRLAQEVDQRLAARNASEAEAVP